MIVSSIVSVDSHQGTSLKEKEDGIHSVIIISSLSLFSTEKLRGFKTLSWCPHSLLRLLQGRGKDFAIFTVAKNELHKLFLYSDPINARLEKLKEGRGSESMSSMFIRCNSFSTHSLLQYPTHIAFSFHFRVRH